MLGIILKSGRWLYPSQETSKFAGWYIKQLFDSFHSCQYRPPVHAWADSRIPSQSSVPWWSLAWGASLRPSPRSLGSCQPWVPLHGISPGPCHPWPMGLAMVPAWLRPPLSSGLPAVRQAPSGDNYHKVPSCCCSKVSWNPCGSHTIRRVDFAISCFFWGDLFSQ